MPPWPWTFPHRQYLTILSPSYNRGLPRAWLGRTFSTTLYRLDDRKPSHYEVLSLQPSATPAEIKKQFYHLSKTSHPDRNPSDPNASSRFASINESYQVLSDPDRRSRYDREIMPANTSPAGNGSPTHRGSYAGSRPASGLSKRRGTFRGPPPSFYAQGGTFHPRPPPNPDNSTTSSGGGFGPGGATSSAENDVPHFDRQATYKTQSNEDNRRAERRATKAKAARANVEVDRDFWIRFIIVTGVIFGTISLVGTLQRISAGEREREWSGRQNKRTYARDERN
ncbi:MAG: hypothetical protein Q9227_005911 [Pyrenula ochraceoflavens]